MGLSVAVGDCDMSAILRASSAVVCSRGSNVAARRSTSPARAEVLDQCSKDRDRGGDDCCGDFGRGPDDELSSLESEVAGGEEFEFRTLNKGSSSGTNNHVSKSCEVWVGTQVLHDT